MDNAGHFIPVIPRPLRPRNLLLGLSEKQIPHFVRNDNCMERP